MSVAVPTSSSVGQTRGPMTSQTGALNGSSRRPDENGFLRYCDQLLEERLVEVGAQRLELRLVEVAPAGVERDRVAGHDAEQEEVEQHDEHQRAQRRQDAVDRVPQRRVGTTAPTAPVRGRGRCPRRAGAPRGSGPTPGRRRVEVAVATAAAARRRRRRRSRSSAAIPMMTGQFGPLEVLPLSVTRALLDRGDRLDALVGPGAVLEQQRAVRRRLRDEPGEPVGPVGLVVVVVVGHQVRRVVVELLLHLLDDLGALRRVGLDAPAAR